MESGYIEKAVFLKYDKQINIGCYVPRQYMLFVLGEKSRRWIPFRPTECVTCHWADADQTVMNICGREQRDSHYSKHILKLSKT